MKLSAITKISRVLVSVLSASILLSSFAAPLSSLASAATAPSAKISFTFDDGEASAYTLAAPALQKYGYKGVDYVTSGCIGLTTTPNTCAADGDHPYMTWSQVQALRSTYGWEIGSHTVTHPLLASTDPDTQPTKLTKAQVIAELLNSKNAITTNGGGVTPVSFATPYGDYEPNGHDVLAETAKLNSSHRGFADTGYNVFPYNDYLLVDQQIQGNVTVAQAKTMIDTAIAGKSWLILTFHHVVSGTASTAIENYEYSVANLELIAQYAQSKGLAGTSIADGIATNPGGTLFANGSFDTAISAKTGVAATDNLVWNTDTAASIKQDTASNGNFPSVTNSVAFTSGAAAMNLWSPMAPVTAKPYVIKSFINMVTGSATKGEVAFYVEEYNAAGTLTGTRYDNKTWSMFASANPLVRSHAFEYTPTAGTVSVRLKILIPAASVENGFIDNVQMFAEDGTTVGGGTVVTPPAGKAGDVNGDTFINALDLSILLSNYNKTAMTRAQGDLSGDGTVNALDLSILLTNWGK